MNTQTKLENTKITRLDLRQLLTEEQEDLDLMWNHLNRRDWQLSPGRRDEKRRIGKKQKVK